MGLADITASGVRLAMDEFDRLGREAFLRRYRFGPALSYVIEHDGKSYDSKAIAGAAHGYLGPRSTPLSADEFSGGEATVKQRLEALGFTVVAQNGRNPPWSRDELILALEFYLAHRDHIPGKESETIADLSRELTELAAKLGSKGAETFRNRNGVYMKLMNFRRLDPDYTSSGGVGLSRGSKEDETVWNDFAQDRARLVLAANLIRSAVTYDTDLAISDDEPEISEASEGKIVTRLHRQRERSTKLVAAKKRAVIAKTGRLACEVCYFDFEASYGERGRGFAECHHTQPLSSLAAATKTRLKDLAIVCANCHRMIHARAPWLTIDALKGVLTIRSSETAR